MPRRGLSWWGDAELVGQAGYRRADERSGIEQDGGVHVDIIVYDGLDELDTLGPFEVLRRAPSLGGEVTVRLVTRRPQVVVQGGHGLRLVSDGVYEPGADIIIVPGGGWIDRSGCGAWAR